MSWSVCASGTPAEVKDELDRQFSYPLADGPAGLYDEGEKTTVRHIQGTIRECLETFDPQGKVSVTAFGSVNFADWDKRTGCYQNVSLFIAPAS